MEKEEKGAGGRLVLENPCNTSLLLPRLGHHQPGWSRRKRYCCLHGVLISSTAAPNTQQSTHIDAMQEHQQSRKHFHPRRRFAPHEGATAGTNKNPRKQPQHPRIVAKHRGFQHQQARSDPTVSRYGKQKRRGRHQQSPLRIFRGTADENGTMDQTAQYT